MSVSRALAEQEGRLLAAPVELALRQPLRPPHWQAMRGECACVDSQLQRWAAAGSKAREYIEVFARQSLKGGGGALPSPAGG